MMILAFESVTDLFIAQCAPLAIGDAALSETATPFHALLDRLVEA